MQKIKNQLKEESKKRESFMKNKLILASIFCLLFTAQSFSQTKNKIMEMKTMQADTKMASKMITPEEAAKNALNIGAKMPSFNLPDDKNQQVSSSDLLKQGNLVIVFYRGAWCPYCNTYLRKLQKNLTEIESNGGKLVAISVENPDTSLANAQKNEVSFTVLSDKHLDLARQFGIVYQLAPDVNEKYKGYGVDLVKQNGTETPDLPLSATYIVNQKGEIVYAYLEPDYKQRSEPSVIIEHLAKIKGDKMIKDEKMMKKSN
jgi:peroxiredoxin